MAENHQNEVIKCSNAPAAVGPYSAGIKSGDLIFLSGQLGLDPANNDFVEGGIEEQTKQALLNLQNVLEEVGADLSNVVKTIVFLNDINDFGKMNAVYAEFFKMNPPARSTVQVSALPKSGLVEIEAIARI